MAVSALEPKKATPDAARTDCEGSRRAVRRLMERRHCGSRGESTDLDCGGGREMEQSSD